MKNFLIFIVKILVVLLLLAYALEGLYTFVYSKSSKRNKVENVVNEGEKNYDIIILGSSRAENHFVPQIFVDKGYTAYNYGMSGATLQESLLLLELMMEKQYKIKNILLEVDLNINSEAHSEGNRGRFMPYLTTNKTVTAFYKDIIPEFDYLYYIPFYRYVQYDAELGFRELMFATAKKTSGNLNNLGFNALQGTGANMKYDISEFYPKRNKYYESIKMICKNKGINLIVVSTPICSTVVGIDYFDKIKAVYPEVHNYENVVVDDKYFFSCGHMNEKGASIFTKRILKDFF